MGKTKWFSEQETQQPGFRPGNHSQRQRRASVTPRRNAGEPLEAPPLWVSFQQVWRRLRRNWIAFRFQFNRFTFGFFHQRVGLKLGLLILVGYGLLCSRREFWIFSDNPLDEYGDVAAVETSLDFEPKSGGKSLKWEGLKKETKDAAPIGNFDLRDEQANDYVEHFNKIALVEMRKYGIPASISLAQGLVESRSTEQAGSRQQQSFWYQVLFEKLQKGHCTNFTDDNHKDFFRLFQSPWESWRAHSQMLASGRYTSLKKYGRDYREWAYGLKRLGYATDRTYAEKLIGVIEKYDLQRFDR